MRGEAKTFRATDGRELTFLFDFEAMVVAEDVAGAGFGDVIAGMASGRFGHLRALIYAGLKNHHPRITLAEVAQLIEDEGEELGEALMAAIESAQPKDRPQNPPTAGRAPERGTGTRSSPRGSRKASTKAGSGNKPRAASRSS